MLPERNRRHTMKWTLLIFVLTALAVAILWWQRMPAPQKNAAAHLEADDAIKDLLGLLYCDISLQEMRDVMEFSDSISKILEHIDAGEHQKALLAARVNLQRANEGGETRDILGAWSIIRELGAMPPPDEAERVLGLVVETNSGDLSAITGAFNDGDARLYSLQGMGLIGEMSRYPKIIRAARDCIVEASKVVEHFQPAEARPHPAPEKVRITLLTPSGFRAFESQLEKLFDESHALAGLFSRVMALQNRLLRVYNGIEGTLEGALLDGDLALVNELLEKGADPDHKDAEGRFPLLEAALNHDLAMIDLLVAAGADIEQKGTAYNLNAFLAAAQQGQPATVRALAAHGADIEARDGDSYSALMISCNRGREDIASALLELGAEVNAKDAEGSTPIMFAAQHGYTEVVGKLLNSNANPNARGAHGFTALGLVMQHGHKETIRLLKSVGATE